MPYVPRQSPVSPPPTSPGRVCVTSVGGTTPPITVAGLSTHSESNQNKSTFITHVLVSQIVKTVVGYLSMPTLVDYY